MHPVDRGADAVQVAKQLEAVVTAQLTQMATERLARVAALAAEGKIHSSIGHRFTHDEAVDTLASIESGAIDHSDKAVMVVSPRGRQSGTVKTVDRTRLAPAVHPTAQRASSTLERAT